MGNQFLLGEHLNFQWSDHYEVVDKSLRNDYLVLKDLKTQEYYIGKSHLMASDMDRKEVEELVMRKKSQGGWWLSKLIRCQEIRDRSYCSYQTQFYFIFEKEATNLKDEKIKRQFSTQAFSEKELEGIIDSVVKGLMRLQQLNQPHGRVSLENIYVREDHSIYLSDPWLFRKQDSVPLDLSKNGYVYPSPQKIHFQNNLGDNYDPYLSDYYSLGVLILQLIEMEEMTIIYSKGYRRINQENIVKIINQVRNHDLERKLKILLDFMPEERRKIEDLCGSCVPEKLRKDGAQRNMSQVCRQEYIVRAESQASFGVNDPQVQPWSPPYQPIHPPPVLSTSYPRPKIVFVHKDQPSRNYSPAPSLIGGVSLTRQSSQAQLQILTQTLTKETQKQDSNVATSEHNQEPIPNTNKISLKILKDNQQQQKQKQPHEYKHTSLNTSFNAPMVKNSIEDKHKPEDNVSINSCHSFGQMFKEVQSMNASEDKSDLMSEVIGHGFYSKESSFKMQGSGSNRGSIVERGVKNQPGTIEERPIEEHLKTQQIQDQQNTTSIEEITKNNQIEPMTPENKPSNKRYNSTIKEVSEEDPSIESLQNQIEERVIQYEGGTKYIGQIKNNKKNGKGQFYWSDNSYYDGYWKDNRMHGKGSLFDASGTLLYQGGWYMDNFQGKGRIFNDRPVPFNQPFDHKNMAIEFIDEYWSAYEGDFILGEKHGKGKLKLSNGQIYVGSFSEDKIHGQGIFYHQNGDIVRGKWIKGFLVSQLK